MLGLREELRKLFLLDIHYPESALDGLKQPKVIEDIVKVAHKIYEEKEGLLSEDVMRRLERYGFLSAIDSHWKEHLYEMDHLKTGIGLRAYGQQNPLVAFKKEAHEMYQGLLAGIQETVVNNLFRVPVAAAPAIAARPQRQLVTNLQSREDGRRRPVKATTREKLGRNDPCWCGSGKKYKHCHWRQDQAGRAVAGGRPPQRAPRRRRRR